MGEVGVRVRDRGRGLGLGVVGVRGVIGVKKGYIVRAGV